MATTVIGKIPALSKSTGLSLNDRFTAIGKPLESIARELRGRSRSRSHARSVPRMERASSVANQKLLKNLVRKHTLRTALKLKRKSLRTAGAGNAIRRRSIKTLRVAPNGRPIRANTMTRVATMKADFVPSARRRPLRRASSTSRISSRLGARRPLVGGAAERVARRRTDRLRSAPIGTPRRGRSRSRSRARQPPPPMAANNRRGRSVSRVGDNRRSRSRSRLSASNARNPRDTVQPRNIRSNRSVPIKARLGVRREDATPADNRRNRNRGANRNRAASIGRRGVAAGRVQKRRNSNVRGSGGNVRNGGDAVRQMGRANGRSAIRNQGRRSRSRTRRNSAGRVQQPQQQQRSGAVNGGRRRGRSQQRPVARGRGAPQRNGKTNSTRKGQQQQTRGRSRSRGGRNNPSNAGKTAKSNVNKDELDKELDQYMATTKTENGINYLY